ncbi:MAG: TolC family protein [Myxococcales bacterium]|nr:TolC family protein [Myxococcales bacterium]
MSQRIVTLATLVVLVIASAPAHAAAKKAPLRVAVVLDGAPRPALARLLARLKAEAKAVTAGGRGVRFVDDKQIDGKHDRRAIAAANTQLLADADVDVVLSFGPLGALDMAARATLSKPVLAPLAIDPRLAPMPRAGKVSGKPNLGYLVYSGAFVEDMRAFAQLVSKTTTQHVLIDAELLTAAPSMRAAIAGAAAKLGLRVRLVAAGADAASTLAKLPSDARAVYLAPMPRLSHAERAKLLRGLRQRKVVTFSQLGRAELVQGAVATQSRGVDLLRVARRVAIDLERVGRGERPETFTIALERQRKLIINLDAARAVGFSPSWRVLSYAEVMRGAAAKGSAKAALTLAGAMRTALQRNLDIRAAQRGVAAGAEKVRQSYAAWMPQVGFSANHRTIRKESADASLGTQPQHAGKLALRLDQTLFVEPALANITIQKRTQRARQHGLDTLELDIVAEAARTYLGVLRSEAALTVARGSAQLSDENLERAKLRNKSGDISKSDVYRWQSQLAGDRSRALSADAQLRGARAKLAQLLRLPATNLPRLAAPQANDRALPPAFATLRPFLETPARFRRFADFAVAEGKRRAPELKQLDAAIAAKKRELVSRKRALWLPQLKLQGELSYQAYRVQGDSPLANISGPGNSPLSVPEAPRLSWYVGVGLNVPLFTGLRQSRERDQASHELGQLAEQRRSTALKIEARIRAALARTRAAYGNIALSQSAAKAASAQLVIAQDAYARGTVTTITLLDAQNNAQQARLRATTARFDYLESLVELQRASGRFELFASAAQRARFLHRLEKHAQATR